MIEKETSGEGRDDKGFPCGRRELGRVIGNYLSSGMFEEDFNELDAQKRVSLLEKLLKYVDACEANEEKEPSESSSVYFSILKFLEAHS